MKTLKRIIFVSSFFAFSIAAFALPGFKPVIEDLSGEFVFYRDRTFIRESYAGFLHYDKKTYAARYFAPEDKKRKLPSKDIIIYFTINEKADHIEMTGEKLPSNLLPEDSEIINYLHDMIYELHSQRVKAGLISTSYAHETADFDVFINQLGGNVEISFSNLIPIFNVMSVRLPSGSKNFYAVATGRLSSASDKSFENFKGFPVNLKQKRAEFLKKSDREEVCRQGNQSVILDPNWIKKMEGIWFLGNTAFISMASTPLQNQDTIQLSLIRSFLHSSNSNFIDIENILISDTGTSCRINSSIYNMESGTFSKNFKIIDIGTSHYNFFTMTVFLPAYKKYTQYFDDIIESRLIINFEIQDDKK